MRYMKKGISSHQISDCTPLTDLLASLTLNEQANLKSHPSEHDLHAERHAMAHATKGKARAYQTDVTHV